MYTPRASHASLPAPPHPRHPGRRDRADELLPQVEHVADDAATVLALRVRLGRVGDEVALERSPAREGKSTASPGAPGRTPGRGPAATRRAAAPESQTLPPAAPPSASGRGGACRTSPGATSSRGGRGRRRSERWARGGRGPRTGARASGGSGGCARCASAASARRATARRWAAARLPGATSPRASPRTSGSTSRASCSRRRLRGCARHGFAGSGRGGAKPRAFHGAPLGGLGASLRRRPPPWTMTRFGASNFQS